jgi:hypothetical protein
VKRCPAESIAIARLSTPFSALTISSIEIDPTSSTHSLVAVVRVGGMGRIIVGNRAGRAARAYPEAQRKDKPQNASQDAAVVELPPSEDNLA